MALRRPHPVPPAAEIIHDNGIDRRQNEQIKADLESADRSFPGVLIWEFGNRWLSIDALDSETAAIVLPDEFKEEVGIPK